MLTRVIQCGQLAVQIIKRVAMNKGRNIVFGQRDNNFPLSIDNTGSLSRSDNKLFDITVCVSRLNILPFAVELK
ncbi:hypothetical protein SRABI106_03274 [Rahnella aquatilis]|nr:hypothetical protein SRABI106_03274 [Rahnella aquatilis]